MEWKGGGDGEDEGGIKGQPALLSFEDEGILERTTTTEDDRQQNQEPTNQLYSTSQPNKYFIIMISIGHPYSFCTIKKHTHCRM